MLWLVCRTSFLCPTSMCLTITGVRIVCVPPRFSTLSRVKYGVNTGNWLEFPVVVPNFVRLSLYEIWVKRIEFFHPYQSSALIKTRIGPLIIYLVASLEFPLPSLKNAAHIIFNQLLLSTCLTRFCRLLLLPKPTNYVNLACLA